MPTTITHLELKTFLTTHLSSYLGTYTHSGGSIPAIAMLPHPQLGYYFPPDNWTVTGIEAVIIRPVASSSNSLQMIGGDISIKYPWKIVLKQHNQLGDLSSAMDALMVAVAQKYSIAKEMGGYVPPAKEGLIIATATVCIVDPTIAANL